MTGRWPAWCGLATSLVIGATAGLPLLAASRAGFIGSHDAWLALFRAVSYREALLEGVLFPRWAPEMFFGYGYPLFNYYAPLSILATALLGLAVPLDAAVHLVFFGCGLLGAVGMWLWLRRVTGDAGAVVGAAAYSLAPFHLVDVYLRGGLPEFLAMALFPWVLWALLRLVPPAGRPRSPVAGVALVALALGAVILSHNVMALLFAPVVVAYGLALAIAAWRRGGRGWGRRWQAAAPLVGLGLGAGLAAFFWLPALLELGLVRPQNLVGNPLVDFRFFFGAQPVSFDLLQSYGRWENSVFSYPLQAGLWQVLMAAGGIVAGAALLLRARRFGIVGWHLLLAGAGSVSCLFLMSWLALPIWEAIPGMSFVQYPWRFLGPLSLFSALAAAFVMPALAAVPLGRHSPWIMPAVTVLLIGVTVVVSAPLLGAIRPVATAAYSPDATGAQFFESMTQTIGTTSIGEYVPAAVVTVPTGSAIAHDRMLGRPIRWLADDHVTLLEAERGARRQAFTVEQAEAGPVSLPIADYAGWRVALGPRSGALTEVDHSPAAGSGLITLDVPSGRSVIVATLDDTPARAVGQVVSWLSLIGLASIALLTAVQSGGPGASARGTTTIRAAAPGAARRRGLVVLVAVSAMGMTVAAGILTADPWNPQGEVTYPGGLSARWMPVGAAGLLSCIDPAQGASVAELVHLADAADRVVGQADRGLEGEACTPPPDPRQIVLPEALPPGPYRLRTGLYTAGAGNRLPILGESTGWFWLRSTLVDLAPFAVQPAMEAHRPPAVGRFRLGELLPPPLGPAAPAGRPLEVGLAWQVDARSATPLVISLQLLDAEGRLIAQTDGQPAAGSYPTTAWYPGTRFADTMSLPIPAAARGPHRVIAVIYDPASGVRQRWDSGEDNVVLGTVEVTP